MSAQWVVDNRALILSRLLEHLTLAGLALLLGLAIALPLALAAQRWPRLHAPLLAVTGVMFTIPSLALFILLMPLTGLSRITALIGLTLYSLLILYRNAAIGLDGADARVLESARALGYSARRRLLTVALPLAAPMILAGLRIASVTLVGMVTVTALIGQGGLGQLFISGFTLGFATPLLVGLVLSVALAMLFDLLLVAVGYWLLPWSRA